MTPFEVELHSNRVIVPPSGPDNARIMLVGEQPGRQEVYYGKPFVGPSGQVLDSCLHSAGISRSECYITNVIKDFDKPVTEYINLEGRVPKVSADGELYIQYLKQEILRVNPNVVVPVGGVALYAITGRTGITKWRGSVFTEDIGGFPYKIVPIVHPAITIPPKSQFLYTNLITMDLIKALKESNSPELNEIPRELILHPNFDQSMDFLNEMGRPASNGEKWFCFDIEVVNMEVSCISFSNDAARAASIAFVNLNGDVFTPDQEVTIWQKIKELLEDKSITKVGQNIGFDIQFLLRRYGIVTQGEILDTMVAQKTIMPDYPMGLDFICSIYTELPYYKAEGKKWFKIGGPWESFWQYNALDSIACAEALPRQMADLKTQGNVRTFKEQCKLIPPLVYMMVNGVRVDVEGMLQTKRQEQSELDEALEDFATKTGGINPASPKQLKEFFYESQGITPYVNKKTKKPSVDEDALKRLSRKGVYGASEVLRIRKLSKRISTYLNIGKVDSDGRYRSSYNPVGTETGRLSSSQNIFGTGGNFQNWPHDLLRFMLPDEGYIFYSFDLSQVENRIVAYVGRVESMIDAFESGKDLHTLTAALIFNKKPEDISDEEGSCSLGSGDRSERFWGKKANHGLNYDLSYKSFALYYELPERDAKFIVERYHRAYPEVRSGYHALVKSLLAKDRIITNLMGRKRLFTDKWSSDLFKKAYAHIPQSSTADKIRDHGLNFIYYNESELFKPIRLVNQVHDSIGFQVPLSLPWFDHARILLEIKQSLETPYHFRGRNFSIPADLTLGLNLFKDAGKEIKAKNFPSDPETLATMLESYYGELINV